MLKKKKDIVVIFESKLFKVINLLVCYKVFIVFNIGGKNSKWFRGLLEFFGYCRYLNYCLRRLWLLFGMSCWWW